MRNNGTPIQPEPEPQAPPITSETIYKTFGYQVEPQPDGTRALRIVLIDGSHHIFLFSEENAVKCGSQLRAPSIFRPQG
jgi:hypothetical protein